MVLGPCRSCTVGIDEYQSRTTDDFMIKRLTIESLEQSNSSELLRESSQVPKGPATQETCPLQVGGLRINTVVREATSYAWLTIRNAEQKSKDSRPEIEYCISRAPDLAWHLADPTVSSSAADSSQAHQIKPLMVSALSTVKLT